MEMQPVVQIAAGSGSDINNQGGEEEEDGQQVLLRCAFIHSIWVDWVFFPAESELWAEISRNRAAQGC